MSRVLDKTTLGEELAAHPLFRSMSAAKQTELLDESMVIHLAPGDLLYECGAPAERVFVVLSGAVQVEHPADPRAKRGFVVAIFAAPSFLGECQVIQETTWSGTGVALVPMRVLGLSKGMLESLMLESPQLGVDLYRDLTRRFLTYMDGRKRQPVLSPPQLIARYLSSYHQVVGEIALSQKEIGRATDLRRETVNRVLKGWTEEGRPIPAGLEALLSDVDPPPLLQRLIE